MATETVPPGQILQAELDQRGWTQTEFGEIIGRPGRLISNSRG